MLAGGTPAQLEAWGLHEGVSGFRYLEAAAAVRVPEHDDSAELAALHTALDAMAVAPAARADLFTCLAGCLHLGNIDFASPPASPDGPASEGGEGVGTAPTAAGGVSVAAPGPMAAACRLLGLGSDDLERCLTSRSMTTRHGAGGTAETVFVPLDAARACAMRDGLAKAVYSSLFEWAVGLINSGLAADPADPTLSPPGAARGGGGFCTPPVDNGGIPAPPSPAASAAVAPFIGLLDIFGFEAFARNSFEQVRGGRARESTQPPGKPARHTTA